MSATQFGPGGGLDLATPRAESRGLAGILSGPWLPGLAARAGAALGSLLGRPVRAFGTVVAARHADVLELLARDLDFRIGPVNEAKIDAVNGGPFVLGMDRGERLCREREALYRALAKVDMGPLRDAVAAEAESRLFAAAGSIDVVNGYARPIAAMTAQRLFGIGRGIEPALFMDAARAIFAHTFLNLSNDPAVEARALAAGGLMRGWFKDELDRRRASGQFGTDFMGALMHDKGLDDDAVRRTLGGMLVGSIDTTASSVAKIVATIAADRALGAQVVADLDNLERMGGWCAEALRRWPHNPIVLRRAAVDTVFNDIEVKKGDLMVAWTQAAMLDATVFPEPALLRPDRPRELYLHFGGGLHPCAGRAVNAFQIPLLVAALVRRGIANAGAFAWAGPFPDRFDVRFERAAP